MTPRKIALLFLLLILAVPPAFASAAVWEFAGWEGGGCYPDLQIDPETPSRMYLTSDVAGIWKSDDAGDSWAFANRGLGHLIVPLLAIAPSDPRVLYAGTGAGLYVSTDGAQNWSVVPGAADRFSFIRPESRKAILISPTDASFVVTGTREGRCWLARGGAWRWKDLGSPFKKRTAITALLWVRPEVSFLAACEEGVALYDLTTSRWTVLADAPKPVTDLTVDPVSGNIFAAGQTALWVSKDGGLTWNELGKVRRGKTFRVAVAADSLYVAWNDGWKGGVSFGGKDGSSWKELDKKLRADERRDPTRQWAGSHGRINALAVHPREPGVLWRTDWWGVWKSVDGGREWSEKIAGAPNTVASDVLITRAGYLYVATMDNGLLMSRDKGRTYETVFPKKYEDDEAGHVWRVREGPDGTILATSSPWNRPFDQVVEVHEDGRTVRHREGLPAQRSRKNTVWNFGYARAIAFHPTDPQIVYLGMDGDDTGGFYVSTDGGRSWKRPRNQPGSLKIYNGLAVDPRDPRRILWGASGARGGVYLSEDGGVSWTHVQKRMRRVFDVGFDALGRAWAAGDVNGPALFVSTDGGRHWKLAKQFGGEGSAEALCFLPDGRVAAGVMRWNGRPGAGIFLSSSDASSWSRLDEGLPEGEGPAAMAYDVSERTLYVARHAGSVYKRELE